MDNVPRNIILDLLPAYIAGEASEESITLIEEFANSDDQIAEYIRSAKKGSDPVPINIDVPKDLEMKTLKKIRKSIHRQMWFVAIATALILMVPLIAMMFTDEVNWTLSDFIVMSALLFGTGFTYVFISRASENILYKIGLGIAVVTGLLLIWVNLAVGIIGSEENPANLLYLVVILIGFIGTIISRFRSSGMAKTLFTMTVVQILVPLIALIIWKPSLMETPGIVGVFIFNTFFAVLFLSSALLFRRAGKNGIKS